MPSMAIETDDEMASTLKRAPRPTRGLEGRESVCNGVEVGLV
jgi:hypothetical protein